MQRQINFVQKQSLVIQKTAVIASEFMSEAILQSVTAEARINTNLDNNT
jgi:hypothetical protein